MGDIIHFNFREKKFEHPEEREKPALERQRDPEYDFASAKEMKAEFEKATQGMHLEGLRSLRVSEIELNEVRVEISKMFERELIDVLAISTPADWAERPAYYKELYEEIQRRLLLE